MTRRVDKLGERFWGHVGLRPLGEPHTKWSPISEAEASRLQRRLSSGNCGSGWIAVETLRNRVLVFDPKQMSMDLLDDGYDGPDGDFVLEGTFDEYAGMSVDSYRRMAEWADDEGDFESNNSRAHKKETLAMIEQAGFLKRKEELRAFLRHTVIQFTDGTTESYEAERANLFEVAEIDGDPDVDIVEISVSEGAKKFRPLTILRMIDIPLIELEAARAELAEDY